MPPVFSVACTLPYWSLGGVLVGTKGWPEHNSMKYTAEIRRVGGSLYKAARGSSNLFLPDTCFSNTVRPVWA